VTRRLLNVLTAVSLLPCMGAPAIALSLLTPDDTSMTPSEVEQVVLDVVRRYTQNDTVAPDADFKTDLRLSDPARQMLFASLAQAFTARGANLPSYQFYLSDFLKCPTPAAVRDAIRAKVFKVVAPAAPAPVPAAPVEKTKAPPRELKPASKKPASRKPASKKPAVKKAAAPNKKPAGAPKGRRGKR
jgi:hypothetical protein